MTEPRALNPALTLAEAWQQQLFQQFWDVQELLARCNMVGAALQVREIHPLAKYVVFEASDQGPYAYLAGATDTLENEVPLFACDDEDYGSWEMRDDQGEHWAGFIDKTFDQRWAQTYFLDIDKVLAEVPVPWSPVAHA